MRYGLLVERDLAERVEALNVSRTQIRANFSDHLRGHLPEPLPSLEGQTRSRLVYRVGSKRQRKLLVRVEWADPLVNVIKQNLVEAVRHCEHRSDWKVEKETAASYLAMEAK